MRSNPVPAGPFGPRDFGPARFGPDQFNPFGPQAFDPESRRRDRPSREDRARYRAMREAFRASMSSSDTSADSDDSGKDRASDGHQHHEHHRGGGRRRRRGGDDFGGFGGPGFGGPGFGGRGFGGRGGPFGRGPRAGRGDIRAGVLALLAEQPRHGYEIITELAERSGGVWRPSPGSIYPTLNTLLEEGLVTVEKTEGRRVFDLTDEGRAYVEAHAEELAAPWDAVSSGVDDSAVQLRDLIQQVGAAVVQVAQAGTPEQVAEAAELLAQTRRSLYRILAEDPTAPAE
jgi:DNA-binding PadR family transcriptional regulator